MKSSKIWKIIWISGIYIILFVILYLVVLYKVKWEGKDLNTYLYFYDCNFELCTTTVHRNDYYSRYLCKNGICPYIDTIIDENLILRDNNKTLIYNYIDNKIINDSYENYRYIGDNLFVVSDKNDKYGIIDNLGNIIVELKHDYIDDYYNGLISYKKDNLYGIIDNNNQYSINNVYDEIILINNNIFAGKKDNNYQIYSYDKTNEIDNNYNYMFYDNGIIVVVNNKKIDILDTNLSSMLLMKIDTFYEYTTGQERDSLKIHSDDNFIYFKVFVNDTQYNNYKYDIANKKLIIY